MREISIMNNFKESITNYIEKLINTGQNGQKLHNHILSEF